MFLIVVYHCRKLPGAPFTVEGRVMNFRGTLAICSADNPAACLMGGYKALHSAIRKCRSCMAVDTDIQTKVGYTDIANKHVIIFVT